MTPDQRLELQILLTELQLDINLCTAREPHIRATQRYLRLKNILQQEVQKSAVENCSAEPSEG